ncbi:uncharacterized protein LOC114754522 [Neltuma alba]|uniref:uncharacterized protein LOC114754522 n=1 Tax=Neltuma alba TaxID=207710 RepID=UPI0010A2B31A|nr:uncharacterized protein LOC114754522 [Prosopis alba]
MWLSIINPSYIGQFFSSNVWDWCCVNLKEKAGQVNEQWRVLFVIVRWLLGKRRNEKLFDDKSINAHAILGKAKAILTSFTAATIQLKQINIQGARKHTSLQPTKMMGGGVTVLVDGAYSHFNGRAGCGGTIIVNGGTVLEAFMLSLNEGYPLIAELWACLIGLKRAWEGGHRRVCLFSDSLETIHLLQEGDNELHENWALIKECSSMIQSKWLVELCHIGREENLEADALAKRALSLPPGLHLTHLEDSSDVVSRHLA